MTSGYLDDTSNESVNQEILRIQVFISRIIMVSDMKILKDNYSLEDDKIVSKEVIMP